MKKFAKNLELAIDKKEELLGHKLTNDDIGTAIGTVGANVWRWRNGVTKRLPVNYIQKLADFLGVSAEWLEHHDIESEKMPLSNNMGNKRSIVDLSALYLAYRESGDMEKAIYRCQYRFFDILPHLNNYLNIFAAIVVTDGLAPRFEVGDAIVVAPKEAVSEGDSVIVVGNPETSIFNVSGHQLAVLVTLGKSHVVVGYNEAGQYKTHKLEASEYVELHKILKLNSLLNIEKQ